MEWKGPNMRERERERERERGSGTTTLSTGHYVLSRERERGSAMKAGIENEKMKMKGNFENKQKREDAKQKGPPKKLVSAVSLFLS